MRERNKRFEKVKEEPKIMFPNYSDSLVNLSSSILNHFGVEPLHSTMPVVDEILGHKHKHVVVILLDGLGMNILENNLYYRDFLRRNLLTDISSVFPPTTTASTTSFLSGKEPVEHGWLGWDVYFEQEDKTVTCFHNTLQGSEEKAADYDIPRKYLPYKSIIDQINEAGQGKAYGIFPFGPEACTTLGEWSKAIKKTIHSDERTFTYAYWNDPDYLLHIYGDKVRDVTSAIRDINAILLDLCENSKETIFFITADHGHTLIYNNYIQEEYPEIANMLERPVSIEPRAISFYVKPEFKDSFAAEFNKHFSEDYMLFTKDEVFEKKLFGEGKPNENFTGLGDFLAVATGHKTLLWNKKQKIFRSHHAGLTREEMRIPLIWYESKPKRSAWIAYYIFAGLLVVFLGFILFH